MTRQIIRACNESATDFIFNFINPGYYLKNYLLKYFYTFPFRFFILLIILCSTTVSLATHLVGGYITYQHLGNNQYRINMRVYRDCNPGTALLSRTLTVDIEDLSNNTTDTIIINRVGPFPHSLDTSKCIIVPMGVCIEYYEFSKTVNLPPSSGGYALSVSECCRNGLIQNVPNPTRVDYYWNTNIPPNDTVGNNSPEFLTPPPVLLCLNQPITDTLYTRDVDGDSLHYELCDIYRSNLPGSNGPTAVVFTPPFTSTNPMPALPPFGINSVTGQLSGTPNQIGHYVLGVCVTDYRNGVPLSTVRLDYEFNVTPCYTIVSDILTQQEDSTLLCSGLTINFTGQTQNANTFFWNFGDTSTTADTSNQRHPTYTFPGPGTYNVMLIAEPGDRCADTAYATFEIPVKGNLDVGADTIYCFYNQPINITVNSIYPDSTTTYLWNFGSGASISSSSQKIPPPVSWSSGGNHYVEVKVQNGKCTWIYGDTIKIRQRLEADIITPAENSQIPCDGLSVKWISESKNATAVKWNFGDPTTTADTASGDTVVYTYPAQGTYTVTLFATQDGSCWDTTTATFEAFPKLEPGISTSGRFCFEAQDVTFEAVGNYPIGTQFLWDLGPTANKPVVKNPSATHISWSEPGLHIVALTTTKGQCTATSYDTINIPQWSVFVDAGPDTTLPYRQMVQLQGSAANSHYWFANRPVSISNPFGQSTTASIPTSNDTVTFYLKVTDVNGCQGIDTMKVYVLADPTGGGYNILTPNGDGRNDLLDLSEYMLGRNCEFTVLNRWGSEVYHAEEYLNDWAGVNDGGRPLPDGTYYYILFCDRTVTAKGPITIINSQQR